MNELQVLPLPAPRIAAPLDASFRPAVLANLEFRRFSQISSRAMPVQLALERADGSVFRFQTMLLPENHPQAGANFTHLERLVKFWLWSRGGFRLHFNGPKSLGRALAKHYRESPTGRFDSEIVGSRINDRPIEVVCSPEIPGERDDSAPLGRHLDGCRIGFDLGGSDRKVAAVMDGKVVFSEETAWDPSYQTDPKYHTDGVRQSLKAAAAHLPRVDAIGGSAAGVYVNNRVKVASLFRGVPADVFEKHVKNMFLDLKAEWGNVPFEVVNDGEVTALAGSMAIGANGVLGVAMGTSMAGGYVNAEGNITSWLNELAFVPVDFQPSAPVDDWSGDYGCGVQYFSQQAVGRLLAPAGITLDASLSLPERLVQVQELMAKDDSRAQKIYETIGTWFGYAVAHYADHYDFKHVLVLGRVTSGTGGERLIARAKEVLRIEFPELADRIAFHVPDEREKRHGQAIAAASLPKLGT